MKKRLLAVLAVLVLSIVLSCPVFASEGVPRLIDEADLLSDSEETDLVLKLDEISERQQVDIAVITLNSLEGESAMEYADYLYEYYGYGFGSEKDGILFLISMEERDWNLSTSGYGIMAFTDAGLQYMSDRFVGDLSDGNYAAAFTTYAELCDDFITQAALGEPYDVGNLPDESLGAGFRFLIALAIGFILSLIVTGIMKSELKSVNGEAKADEYIKQGGLQLSKQNDLFLYKHVNRREKAKNESAEGSTTHTSDSGKTHGGSGGKF